MPYFSPRGTCLISDLYFPSLQSPHRPLGNQEDMEAWAQRGGQGRTSLYI